MIGELDSSHGGCRVAPASNTPAFRLGPLALADHVEIGDTLLAVDGVPVDPHVDVAALFADTTGKRTELRIAPSGNVAAARTVVVLPVNSANDTVLRYRGWVVGRRASVDRSSSNTFAIRARSI